MPQMKTMFGLGVMLVASTLLAGCSSDDEGVARPTGTAGSTGFAGMGNLGASGRAGAAGSLTGGGTAGAGGGAPSSANLGLALEFVPGTGDVPYAIGPNAYGIRGGAFLARAAMGNTITVGNEPGKICISGNLEEVPNGNYSAYWGVEIGFNLNQGAAPGEAAESALDAGLDASADAAAAADAAPVAEVAQPWQPGNVVGFSFVIEGPTINLIRFKALPAGFDRSLEASVYCKTINASSNVPQEARFAEMAQYCWNDTANVLIPTGNGLDNISWQLPADVAPTGARPFDWCLKELRPILAD
jgi:hypothetical protein